MCHSERVAVTQSAPSASSGAPRTVVRFLILPGVTVPSVASRILAANLRRLRRDWEAVFGHTLLLAETFVDVARFRRTCYRASNWLYVGDTRGFARRGASYQRHGRPKAVFVYPLQRHARDRLRALDSPHESRKPEGTQMVKLDIQTGSSPGTTSPMG